MSTLQAIVLAIVQGITELFPISSLGHAVVLPAVLGWHINESSETFLPFLVVVHLGTAAALLLFFRREWIGVLSAAITRQPSPERVAQRRLLLLIVAATIPAGLIGLLLQNPLQRVFGTPWIAALFLIVNGLILLLGERQRRKGVYRHAEQLSWGQAVWIGIWQSTALIPGISRSGVTMVAGLVGGLSHEEAAQFSFLLATPIIGAAGLLEVPKLIHHHGGQSLSVIALSGIVAGIAAFASVTFVMRYFRRHDFEALDPFAYYCMAAGVVSLLVVTLVR